jgi:RND superfamily putative drug exporter
LTERLARSSALHPWRTVGLWFATVAVSVVTIGALLGDALTTDAEITNDPESYQAYRLLAERLPPSPGDASYGTEIVLVRSSTLTIDDPAFSLKVKDVARAVERTGAAERVSTFYDTRDRTLVSPDRDAAVVLVEMGSNPEDNVERLIEAARAAHGGAFDVTITGEWTADEDFNTLSQEDLEKGELYFGLPASLVVLLLVFGAVVAGLVPLLLAIVAIVVALALTALVGQAFDLSIFVVNMLSGMGLALGIDYSLFVLSRFREERRQGTEPLDAIGTAGATSSRAVLFSGFAFVVSMFGMVLVPDTILRSLAAGAILVGVVAVLAAMTLLPALLSLLGDRIDALRIPFVGRSSVGEGRFWSSVVGRVMRRPVACLAVSVALLVAAAVPLLAIDLGFSGLRTLPDRFPSKQGFNALEEEFGVGTVNTVQVVVDGDVRTPDVRAALGRLSRRMEASGDFLQVRLDEHPDERLAVIEALPAGDSNDPRAIDAVERVREVDVPAAFRDVDARVLVTGETAEAVDYFELIRTWLPIVFVFVLGLSLVLLTIAFRSVVVAVKAVLLNLLSVGAAYGLLVLVFQKGVGNEIFGFQQVDAIEAWVPLFLFSVLFGLSMDYHVFLLSRIRERYGQTHDNTDAVTHGVASTARLITGAALIIIAVFAGFARGDLVMFQQMGFGVSVSLLIDATLIRSVLLPAAMKLLGDWNWYLPRWLDWLPHLDVEAETAGRPRAAAEAP